MKITAEPRSDQINADDFVGGPATFTIAGVSVGKADQKYDIDLVEVPGRAWRPPLTVLRLLMAAWGDESSTWVGRRVTLYRDPSVKMAGDTVGGIRVSHMSDLPGNKPFSVKVSTSRGKRGIVSVEPLTEPTSTPNEPKPAEPTTEQVAECEDVVALREMWKISGPERQEQIKARVAELNGDAS